MKRPRRRHGVFETGRTIEKDRSLGFIDAARSEFLLIRRERGCAFRAKQNAFLLGALFLGRLDQIVIHGHGKAIAFPHGIQN